MTNFFFISSPLHFFIATNLAIANAHDRNIAIFISKKKENSEQYYAATEVFSDLFLKSFNLSFEDDKKLISDRKRSFKKIKNIILADPPDKIFTGNDRRVEFQYAMHQALQVNSNVQGIYLDDGAISYLGHKSIDKFSHRHIDPLFKKLVYGTWWDSPLTVGSSKWISAAYLAFPEHAHKLLQNKTLFPIEHNHFESEQFLSVNRYLTKSYTELDEIDFTKLKVVLCLPNESSYIKNVDALTKISKVLASRYHADEIAIKVHPRSKELTLLKKIFTDSTFLPLSLGMELLLPKLDEKTQIIGDVSTALLTTKWLRPELSVYSFELGTPPSDELQKLFDSISIQKLSYVPSQNL